MHSAMGKYRRLIFVAFILLLISCTANINSEIDYNEPSVESPTDTETQPDSNESNTSTDSETNTDSSNQSQPDAPDENKEESNKNDESDFSDQSDDSDINQNDDAQNSGQDESENPTTSPSEEKEDEKPNIASGSAKSIASEYGLGHFTLKPNTDYDTGYISTVESYKGPHFDYKLKGSTDENGSGTIEAILYCEKNHLSPDTGLKFKIVPYVRVEGTVEFVNGKVYDVSSARVWYYLYYDGMINAPKPPFSPFELNSADKELINQYLQSR